MLKADMKQLYKEGSSREILSQVELESLNSCWINKLGVTVQTAPQEVRFKQPICMISGQKYCITLILVMHLKCLISRYETKNKAHVAWKNMPMWQQNLQLQFLEIRHRLLLLRRSTSTVKSWL